MYNYQSLPENERAILDRLEGFDIGRLIRADGSLDVQVAEEADRKFDLLWVLSGVTIDEIQIDDPLSDVSRTVASVLVEIPISDLEAKKSDAAEETAEPTKRALNLAEMLPSELIFFVFANAIARGIEIERRTGPILEELYKDPLYEPTLKESLLSYFAPLFEYKKTQTIEEITARVVEMGPAHNDVNDEKVIVAIPVAGHQEYDNIFRTLEQFTNQTLPTNQFEIVLHVNVSAHEKAAEEGIVESELAANFSKTLAEIERFKQAYPDIAVRHFTTTYRGKKQTIGRIRSDLWEAIGWDLVAREAAEDILILSADADIVHVNSTYLESLVETAKTSKADMIAAGLKWQTIEDLPYDAYANKILRYQTFLDRLRNRYTRIHTADANTAIRASSYFASGGYDKDAVIGEMRDIRARLEALRSERSKDEAYFVTDVLAREVVALAPKAELKTHSRRIILAMALGYSPYHAWDQEIIEFGVHDELRTTATQGSKAEEQARIKWREWVDEITPHYLAGVPEHKRQALLDAALKLIGF